MDLEDKQKTNNRRLFLLERDWEDIGYDENIGFVIRAQNEKEARSIASNSGEDELDGTWLDVEHVSCKIIPLDGKSEVILGSFNAG